MSKLRLRELQKLYENLSSQIEGLDSELDSLKELIDGKLEENISEDLSDATSSGMGGVYSSQPSSIPGALNGANWINGGGESGSGDISVPYNPSGSNRIFHKIKSTMGKNHGSSTGKKSRSKKIDLKKLMSIKKSKDVSGSKRVMSFDDFKSKSLINDVTKVTK
jgi:hypothetical protein